MGGSIERSRKTRVAKLATWVDLARAEAVGGPVIETRVVGPQLTVCVPEP
jgi:hypothetical protein